MPSAVDGVALGAMLLACAVERAERGTTVVVAGAEGEIAVRWEGEDLPEPVAGAPWRSRGAADAASLAPHLARRRLAAGRRATCGIGRARARGVGAR